MNFDIAIATMLHLLVLVYWLGGDLGAFYSSGFFTDAKRPMGERMLALKILNNIDMAPRTALVLAFPSGLLLAWLKGWLAIPGIWVFAVCIGFLLWLALAWKVHLSHGPAGEPFRKVDLAVRYVVLIALVAAGAAGLSGMVSMPLFIAAKLLVLAACITMGLWVRVILRPMMAVIGPMLSSGPTPEMEAVLKSAMAKARVPVLIIWALVLIAAYLGVSTPV